MKIARIVATAAAALGLALVGGQAHAAPPIPTDGLHMMWHEPGRGYVWSADGVIDSAPSWGPLVRACQASSSCRSQVRTYYTGLRHEWRSFNAGLWADVADGTGTASTAQWNLTAVTVDGVTYLAQNSTRP